jgi:hypothetical protein
MLGLKPARHRPDGYNDFGFPEDQYDLARAHDHIISAGTAPSPPESGAPPSDYLYSTHHRLKHALDIMPESVRKILFFVPFALPYQGAETSLTHAYWAECKRRVARMARSASNSIVVDFMIPSPITREEGNYYDAIHFRPAIADRLAADLALAAAGETGADADYQVLSH